MISKHAKAAKTNAKRFSIEAHCCITTEICNDMPFEARQQLIAIGLMN